MKKYSTIKIFFSGALLFLVITIVISWDVQWDLTSDKRYSHHPLAKQMVRASQDQIIVTILLEGKNIPSSFRGYRSYIDQYVSELRRYNNNVEVIYKNPLDGESQEEIISFRRFLSSRGVEPLTRQAASESDLLYPFLSVHNSEKIIFVDLLESQQIGEAEEESLLRSQLSFEGKFLRALRQLTRLRRPEVHIIGYRPDLLADGYNRDERLSSFRFVPSSTDQLLARRDSVSAILSVIKKSDLSRTELLAIDVVGGSGVPVLWLIDKYDVTIDSLQVTGEHLAITQTFSFEDYLFKCGIRILPKIIMDIQSSRIPQRADDGSSTAEIKMLNYPYHPIVITGEENPPSTKLSTPLPIYFAAPLELLEYPKSVMKEVILGTSPYTRTIGTPALLNFGFMQVEPDRKDYNEGRQTLGVKVEGRVSPYYKNRLIKEDIDMLRQHGMSYNLDSQYIEQVIVSDADFALPTVDDQERFFPIGWNPSERQMYDANTQLISNLLESMIDGDDILALSHKTTALSILDLGKYKNNATFYQFILLGIPLALLFLTYVVYHILRKRKYAQ